jgi:type VII secretion protein EccE
VATLPLDLLVRAIDDAEYPGAVLQVVTHTVPTPTIELDGNQLAARSYRELQQSLAPVPIPADRITWVTVRLDARSRAEAGVAAGDDAEHAPALVAALIRRVARELRQAGVVHRILDADGVLDALTRSCDLEPVSGPAPGPEPASGSEPAKPQEGWRAWYSGRLAHASFWIRDWPAVAGTGAVLDRLSTAPAVLSSVALILAPAGEAVSMRCLVRVAAPPNRLGPLCQALTRGASQARAYLFRLDGEQAPAVYASAPTGGGAK